MASEFLELLQEQIKSSGEKNPQKNSFDLESDQLFPALTVVKTPSQPMQPYQSKKLALTTERFVIKSPTLAKQSLGKRSSCSQICQGIMQKFNSKIEYSTNQKSLQMTFLVKGTPEAIQNSKKHLLNMLTAKVTNEIKIPLAARAAVIGKQGSTLKKITEITSTTIDVQNDKSTEPLEINVQITGNQEAIEEAVHEIDAIVSLRMQKHYQRLKTNRSLIQFITGYLIQLENEFSVQIKIPQGLSLFEREEIVIIGRLEDTLNCENRISGSLNEIVLKN